MNCPSRVWWSACLLCAILTPAISGCGGAAPSNRPKTIAVKGAVTYKGAPVADALLTFIPKDAKGKGAVGKTDASGQYQLTTFAPGDGAVPGSYSVTIAKTTSKSPLTEDQEHELMGKGMPLPPPVIKDELPVKYKQDKTSGLTAEVKEGAGPVNFDLTD
jgi:hypothetical protein